MKEDEIHIGIVGAGGFAFFASAAFASITGVKIKGVYDPTPGGARLAARFGATSFQSYPDLLQSAAIDLIYIATPPFLHYEQSRDALHAGKHVICEKPAALTVEQALSLQAIANSKQLLYVVNLMQRYNPLYAAVKMIVDQNFLGGFLHGYFENYASDENLAPDHWFWDQTKSGGIFIEHGVHFFDLFAGWFGKGKLLSAIQLQRPGIQQNLVDRVQATVLYNNAVVNFYHGFDQPKVLDRQELRLEFERGDITLYEWVPVEMKLNGLLKKGDFDLLQKLVGDLTIKSATANATGGSVIGRFQTICYDEHVRLKAGDSILKEGRYKELLVSMLLDQWDWIKSRDHKRIVDASNAVESLRMAEQASKAAQYITVDTPSNGLNAHS